jgi:hypothetical protein
MSAHELVVIPGVAQHIVPLPRMVSCLHGEAMAELLLL